MLQDHVVQERKEFLIKEARITLLAITQSADPAVEDPFTDADSLAGAVEKGIMDAPHLKNNPFAQGKIHTRIIQGACEAVNEKGDTITESQRLQAFL